MNRTTRIVTLSLLTLTASQGVAREECNEVNFSVCLDGVGPAVTNPDSLRVSSSQLSKQTNRQSEEQDDDLALSGGQRSTGLSAGDYIGGWGIWASYNHTAFDADLPINSAVQPIASYDGDLDSVLIGIDRLIGDRLLVGLALGYEMTDTETAYNGGNNESEGFTLAPYLALLFNDVLSADISGGYTDLEYETDRIDNQSGGQITGDFDSSRWFIAANLNALRTYNQWVLGVRLGFIYSDEEQDAYTETGPNTARSISERNIDLKQFLAGIDIAYGFNGLEPYVSAYYYNDISRDDGEGAGGLPSNIGRTQPDDDDEFQVGIGLRYFYQDNVSGSLEYNKVLNRNKFDADSFLFTIRIDL